MVPCTTEHKTSAVGEKKEQYLPFVVPWDGVTNDNWLRIFLELYQQVGLDIHIVPLGPVLTSDREIVQWFIYTDAAYNKEEQTGGIGAVLVDQFAKCVQWFGFHLNKDDCKIFGCQTKKTVIYELELVAAVHALSRWGDLLACNLATWFGDNDRVRYALIRGAGTGPWGEFIMKLHLEKEAALNTRAWFVRVPTEANIADYPSRLCPQKT